MSPPLFWIDDVPSAGAQTTLRGSEGRHAVTVTRLRAGEPVILGDGRGATALCEVTATSGKDALVVRALSYRFTDRRTPRVILVQALPKSERSELVVELVTEAGVDEIVPWQASRCVAKWSGGKADHRGRPEKAERGVVKWRATAAAAAKQSRRPWIPEVTDLATTTVVRARCADAISAGGQVLALHEDGAVAFRGAVRPAATEIVLIVGPEGGLADSEIADFAALGATTVVLGPEVLRTSTAAAVALGGIGTLTDRWDPARGN
ncbi:16S rRNA (uracil(1498)-N(3))-methyltransferase [Gordonia sp. CPCC 205333]|uniref:16S rRNA (uracil(1498)-N(3))-methyltransferase n=1 Tax=Gordonia sp. CPCC 205333 TaxID=3140790 RepID=UPI003AF3699D